VDYNKEFPLGEGNFGVVYKGVRNKSDGDWEEVAIKEIKDTDTMASQAHDDMEREVKLMKNLSHENIVKIRGVITNNNNTIIVMEFIREGSLDRYLQVNRHNIDNPKQLFGYAQNIADGMDYLVQNKIIHRDLAARNILVADQETVKISDFGLARVATNDCYVMNSSSNIPVRWEAIECLTHRKYSHKSDVWSFGVTLWEMFSFGATPALEGCQDFFSCFQRQQQDFRDWLSKLEDGIRLPQTELCTNFLYSRIMKTCWMKDPVSRPNFRDLKFLLRQAELEVT
jgi:serine/threonine protein kinase